MREKYPHAKAATYTEYSMQSIVILTRAKEDNFPALFIPVIQRAA